MANEGDAERLVVLLEARIRDFEKNLAKASGTAAREFGQMRRSSRSATAAMEADVARSTARINQLLASTSTKIGSFATSTGSGLLGGIGAALGVAEIARAADAWTAAANKIRAAATSTGVAVRSLEALKDGANGARVSLEDYVDLYARLIRSASGVAQSEAEIAQATDTVAKAFKAGGASAAEQASGILQLGQALGSGVLQGDELRSLRENAPILAQAIADEFGVTISGLKKLGEEGALTSDRVFRAIINAQKPIEAQFRATNATIADSIGRLRNEFQAYVGLADTSAGASRGVVAALDLLASNFAGTANAVVTFATVLSGALAGRALQGVVAGLGSSITALGSFIAALRTGSFAAATFTAALGPIGLLAGAAAAAVLLFTSRETAAERATRVHEQALGDLRLAFTNAQGGAKSAADEFTRLAAANLKAAKAAVANAEAQVQAAEAMVRINQEMPGISGEDAFMSQAIGNPGFSAKALEQAKAALAQRKTDLAEIERFLADPLGGMGGSTGYGGATGAPAGGSSQDKAAEGVQRQREAVDDLIASLEEELRLVGASDSEIAVANNLRQAGAAATDEQKAKIQSLTMTIEAEEAAWRAAREAQDLFAETAFDAIDRLALGGENLNDVLQDVVKSLARAALEATLLGQGPLAGLLGTASTKGGTGGLFGTLFSGIGGLFGFADGGFTGPGSRMQPAGIVHAGEVVWSQDDVRRAGGVGAAEAIRRGALPGYADGGPVLPTSGASPAATSSVVVNQTITVDARGADANTIARVQAVAVPRIVEAAKQGTIQALRDGLRRNPYYLSG